LSSETAMESLSTAEAAVAAGVPVLARLAPADRAAVLAAARVASYPAGAVVVREGDPGDAFYVVLAGRIAVGVARADGGETRVAELGPGTWFGEQALLGAGGHRTATVRALAPMRCAVVPCAAFAVHVAPVNRAAFDEAAAEQARARLVRSLAALRDLDPARRLGPGVGRASFPRGATVFARGTAADAAYFVLQGVAVAVHEERDGVRELARLGPGQCFGELGVLEHATRQASVVAETALEVLRIDAPLFRELFAEHPPLRDFLGTLEQVYALADGRQLSVYSGEVDGRPSISTVSGDPAGDCVVSTKVIGEDVVVLSRGGHDAAAVETRVFHFPNGAARELRLAPLEHGPGGAVTRARLVGVVARVVGPDVGPLYAHVLEGAEVGATELKRFARTGHLGGHASVRDAARVCHCLGLAREDILAAGREHGRAVDAVRAATGAGVVCGACQPLVRDLLRGEAAAEPQAAAALAPVTTAAPARQAAAAPAPAAHPFAAPVPVPRLPAITFDRDAVRAFAGATLGQVLLAASLFASAGERYMIRRVGRSFAAADHPALAPHVEAFLAQEANHVTAHAALNAMVVDDLFPGSPILALLQRGFPAYVDRLPEKVGLGFAAAIEYAADCFFAVFFERYYGHGPDARRFHADPDLDALAVRSGVAELFVWHGAEELAHRHVAFDVMQARGAGYRHRLLGLLMVAAHSHVLGLPAIVAIRRRATAWQQHGSTGRQAREIGGTAWRMLRFLRPGFHPRETTYACEAPLADAVSHYPVDTPRGSAEAPAPVGKATGAV